MAKPDRTLINEKENKQIFKLSDNWKNKGFKLENIEMDASKANFSDKETFVERLSEINMGKDERKKQVSKEGGLKYSKGKLEWNYFPFDAAKKIMEVIQHGSKKYDWNNWKKNPAEIYYDAGIRHLIAHLCGEKIDKDSGLTHLAMVNCNFLFALWVEECKNAT